VNARVRDSVFVAVAVLLTLVVYVGGLGFNSDDWAFLGTLSTAPDQHNIVGLSQALYASDNLRPRPLQVVYFASQYALFGLNPTGYHLVNAAVLAVGAVLLYLVLRELDLGRPLALAIAVVYACLPNYSADRFWLAAAQAPLSVALYLLSLLADLRLANERAHVWRWKSISAAALIGSGLAYELAVPFFLLNLVWLWRRGGQFVRQHAAVVIAPNLVALAAVVVFKMATTQRLVMNESYPEHILYLLTGVVKANYVTFVAGIPVLTWWSVRGGLSAAVVLVGAILLLMLGVYVYRSFGNDDRPRAAWLELVLAGVFVSFWGYAIFINNDNVVFSTANVDSRTAIMATAGVATVVVGGIGWLSSHLRVGRLVFSGCVAGVCLYGFLVVNRLATFWEAAYQQDLAILDDIQQRLPSVPGDTTLILDGTCPEVGPAFVFRFNWDMTGALATLYRDPSLKGTVVTPDRKLESSDLLIRTFRDWDAYPYGPNLLIFNARQNAVHTLADADQARAYFDALAPEPACAPPFSWLR
jgi:hypothetical protein